MRESLRRLRQDGEGPDLDQFAEIALFLVDRLDAMVAYWSRERICLFANQAYRAWFGRSRAEIVGIEMKQLLGPLYYLNLPHIEAAFAGEKRVFERMIVTPEGETRSTLVTYIPHILDQEVRGIVAHVADVGPLKSLQVQLELARERAEYLAAHDALTGLRNRRYLSHEFARIIETAHVDHLNVHLICLDVDDFKSVNDTFGHAAGDALLTEFADRLLTVCRPHDTVVRLAGDEFVVVASCAESSGANDLIGAICQCMNAPFDRSGAAISASISVGTATFPSDGETLAELMAVADAAMYVTKRARNKDVAKS